MQAPLLIAGANGMLGWDLCRFFRGTLGDAQVVGLSRSELDISSRDSVRAAIEKYQPAVVINAAAYTNVDKAETERDLAASINVAGPALLTEQCRASGAKFVHFSTDQVFDGTAGRPYVEADVPHPLNWYASTKLDGERAALEYPASMVIRVQWLYGETKDRFSPLRTKETFSPFSDQYGSPTWTKEIARTVSALLAKNASGLFHLSYDDYASWSDVFAFVKEKWRLSVKLEPRKTESLQLPAKRPLFSVLDNAKLCETLGAPMGSWKRPLGEFLDLCAKRSGL